MNHTRTAIASGLLAFALIAPAHADLLEGTATASITNITYKLQDGWLPDNLKPSITWASPDSGAGSKPYTFRVLTEIATVDESGHSSRISDDKLAPTDGSNIFTPTSSSLTNGTASTQGSIASNAISSQAHASIDLGNPAHDQEKSAQAHIYAPESQFVLSPFSRITITGNYATSVAGSGGDGITVANASGSLWLESSPDKYSSFYFGSERSFGNNPRTGEAEWGDAPPKNGTFTLTLSNNTPNSTRGVLSLSVRTYTNFGSVSSVPEPETIALMLAGLGVVASTRRRKRR